METTSRVNLNEPHKSKRWTYLPIKQTDLLKPFPGINMTLENDFFGAGMGVVEDGTGETKQGVIAIGNSRFQT